ncbi:MAG: T9SS type A sorting domain-containing protein [Flavobacteriales bacterium]
MLLYRMDAYDDWREYEFYSKNDFTLNDDGFGLMELTKLLPGEYTLANVDHTVLGSEEIGLEPQMSLYPNPAKGYVLIRLENSYTDDVKAIQILDIQGKTVLESELAGDHATISTSDLPNGTYICRLKSSTGTISRKFVVEQ